MKIDQTYIKQIELAAAKQRFAHAKAINATPAILSIYAKSAQAVRRELREA